MELCAAAAQRVLQEHWARVAAQRAGAAWLLRRKRGRKGVAGGGCSVLVLSHTNKAMAPKHALTCALWVPSPWLPTSCSYVPSHVPINPHPAHVPVCPCPTRTCSPCSLFHTGAPGASPARLTSRATGSTPSSAAGGSAATAGVALRPVSRADFEAVLASVRPATEQADEYSRVRLFLRSCMLF